MNILCLGEVSDRLIECFEEHGDNVSMNEDKITSESRVLEGCEFILSYGYRYIIGNDVINMFPNRIVNMHISYLPWNRGADANLWSFLEDTKKGVSIHHIDVGLDTGKLIAQRYVEPRENDTLSTSYARLKEAVEDLLIEHWIDIRKCKLVGKVQPPGGSYHRTADRILIDHLLDQGWDTPVCSLKIKFQKHLKNRS